MYELMGMCICFVMWIACLMVGIMLLGDQVYTWMAFYLHSSCFYGNYRGGICTPSVCGDI